MQHDPERVAEVRTWLTRALDDLRAADASMAVEPPLLGVSLFHCQQAVEKSIKGFLSWHDKVFRKTHNLVEIGEMVAAIDPTIEPLLRKAAGLTEYAWRFRYPGESVDPTIEESEEALAIARQVFNAISAKLPKIVRP